MLLNLLNPVLTGGFVGGQEFTVIRRRQALVDGYAEPILSMFTAVGTVQPGSPNSEVVAEQYRAQQQGLWVATPALLYCPGEGPDGETYMADLILWQGSYYQVRQLEAWGNFDDGTGHCEADCLAYDWQVGEGGTP